MLLCGMDDVVTALVSQHVSEYTPYTFDIGIGALNSEGEFIAGVAYSNYRRTDIEMTCWGRQGTNWLTPGNLSGWYAYPFIGLGVQRVTALVAKRNKPSRQLMSGLGYHEEGKIRRAFINDDCMVYGLLREEWERDSRFHAHHKTKYFPIERHLLAESTIGSPNQGVLN